MRYPAWPLAGSAGSRIKLIMFISVTWLVLASSDDTQSCADASLLMPFLLHQFEQGTSLIVFQGTAIPQVL